MIRPLRPAARAPHLTWIQSRRTREAPACPRLRAWDPRREPLPPSHGPSRRRCAGSRDPSRADASAPAVGPHQDRGPARRRSVRPPRLSVLPILAGPTAEGSLRLSVVRPADLGADLPGGSPPPVAFRSGRCRVLLVASHPRRASDRGGPPPEHRRSAQAPGHPAELRGARGQGGGDPLGGRRVPDLRRGRPEALPPAHGATTARRRVQPGRLSLPLRPDQLTAWTPLRRHAARHRVVQRPDAG